MSKRRYQDNKRDAWHRIARSKGYRTRSAYKLKQIQERFGILREGDVVLDVGCHPGGWTQVAVEEVREGGLVVGVDLLATSPVEGARIIIGDITDEVTIGQIRDSLGERELNVVISDISPNLTGRYDTDQTLAGTLHHGAGRFDAVPPARRLLRDEDLSGNRDRGVGRCCEGPLLQRPEVRPYRKQERFLGDLPDLPEQAPSATQPDSGQDGLGAGPAASLRIRSGR